jgi:hypothetical protein
MLEILLLTTIQFTRSQAASTPLLAATGSVALDSDGVTVIDNIQVGKKGAPKNKTKSTSKASSKATGEQDSTPQTSYLSLLK